MEPKYCSRAPFIIRYAGSRKKITFKIVFMKRQVHITDATAARQIASYRTANNVMVPVIPLEDGQETTSFGRGDRRFDVR